MLSGNIHNETQICSTSAVREVDSGSVQAVPIDLGYLNMTA